MDFEKNIYGLSEGVFKACQFLDLKFPSELPPELQSSQEHTPSDYFGDNFELTEAMQDKLRFEKTWDSEKFKSVYEKFIVAFYNQKPLKHAHTDLNIYFCDYLLFAEERTGATPDNYFAFEFYRKSFELRDKFKTDGHFVPTKTICNDPCAYQLSKNKVMTNKFFATFLNRDYLDTRKCAFIDFKAFVEKHPRFFSKPFDGSLGKGAEIITVDSEENLKEIFKTLKKGKRILEEVVIQHETLAAFCADSINTIRINTIFDIHNVVHFLTTSGRFGRVGKVVDNYNVEGYAVIIDPKTGIIISDGINQVHERATKHPDTGKTFKGFQYPSWKKVRAMVIKMAKMVPQLRYVAWDVAINHEGEPVLIEINALAPGINIQQAPDDTGRLHLYQPFLDEMQTYKEKELQYLGYQVNNLQDFISAYKKTSVRVQFRLHYAIERLIPDCTSLIDLGCRQKKFAKSVVPPNVKYYPVDYEQYDDEEITVCDFNRGEFPDLKADTCLCSFTAEFVEPLPQFLANMCNAAQKQVLMWCCPVDKEHNVNNRWNHPFLTDFTEEFLIKTMERNGFQLHGQYAFPHNLSAIFYDFRRIADD